jgi:hypothetical protein
VGCDRKQPQGAVLPLTPAGKKQLAAEKREWNRMITTMQAILNEPS